jgi:hypothetical protein
MNPTLKSSIIAGIVALVVAVGVLAGARALTPTDVDNSGVVTITPDGSVIGQVMTPSGNPVRASSGPPVPACNTVDTFLQCNGTGMPFTWNFPPSGTTDAGFNEAFGTIIPGNYNNDAGLQVIAKATITPKVTGQLALTSSVTIPAPIDAGCPDEAMTVGCSIHNDASTITFVSAGAAVCIPGSPSANQETVYGGLGGAVSNLEVGTAYDCFLTIVDNNGSQFQVLDGSTGGIWLHEYP